MKIVITMLDGSTKTIECDTFEFEGGFLKIVKPFAPGCDILEMYVPVSKVITIENYGPLKSKAKKTTKK